MEKKTSISTEIELEKQIKNKSNIISNLFSSYLRSNKEKKERIKNMKRSEKITFYTKELFINSCMAFVYDFILRVVWSVIFLKGHWPTSILGYFVDYLFVKYGFYYTILWIVSVFAALNYLVTKNRNIKYFYISWIAVALICLFQLLIDFRVYVNFIQLLFTFNFLKIINLFQYHSFQIEIFVLFWSVTNIWRFVFVSSQMAKIKINISEVKD